ncbi:hypothetical protein [Zooshikella ganghwensis]|uniref:PreQ(1) synthase n=1 Tax=Zooshikella ganghwensis TaxID=202772 RepID=A0A4P9VID5_9GAMM|nr:hypothetical protein [Zooshikella ganghwensis]RDH42219.1 hypothetical protein B9G39_01465 [Zooshikella ganghwensis]
MKHSQIKALLAYHTESSIFTNQSILQAVYCGVKNRPTIILSDLKVRSLSARNKEPYTAIFTVEYQPNEYFLELISFEKYLASFEGLTTYLEQLTDVIYSNIFDAIKPKNLKVEQQRTTFQGYSATIIIDSNRQG